MEANNNSLDLDPTKREINENINSISDDCLESENNLKKKLFSYNKFNVSNLDEKKNQNNNLEEIKILNDMNAENSSPILNILHQDIKTNKLLDEKENLQVIVNNELTPSSQRNINSNKVHVQDKPIIEFNKLESDNEETVPKKNKKNNFKFNFLEYFLLNTMCCFRKNEKVSKKNILLDNSEDFCDYYLDINTYIKKMIEIDLLKLYLIKNRDDLKAIENFKPAMKSDYSANYNEKIEKMYKNLMDKDLKNLNENIKNMETRDNRIYKMILSFYN